MKRPTIGFVKGVDKKYNINNKLGPTGAGADLWNYTLKMDSLAFPNGNDYDKYGAYDVLVWNLVGAHADYLKELRRRYPKLVLIGKGELSYNIGSTARSKTLNHMKELLICDATIGHDLIQDEYYHQTFLDNHYTIENGIIGDRFPRADTFEKDTIMLGMSGLAYTKETDYSLIVFKNLLKKYPEKKGLIFTPPDKTNLNNLKEFISILNLQNYITIKTFVPRIELYKRYIPECQFFLNLNSMSSCGRCEMDFAKCGNAVITSNNRTVVRDLYPYSGIQVEMLHKAEEMCIELIENRKFYHKVCDTAYENYSKYREYNFIPKLRNIVEEVLNGYNYTLFPSVGDLED
jgi:glycosyltransferase involved in cell wall biosynthesis